MSPYVIQDFVIVKIAGHGGLSEIKKAFIGALPKIRRVPYALKILLKQNVIEYGQERTVIRERDVMSSLSCRFCVNFLCSFQDEARLYIAMEWAYGELDDVLRNRKAYEARFYACELVVAIDYLHSRNIVHRDIQPRNILLDAQGHIRLGDFGYSRFLDPTETSRSFCGSSGYTAPEILIHSEHGMSVDWYSLGIVLYELVSGSIPHRPSDSKLDDYRNLVSGTISFRDGLFSERCRDLISKLCDPNPKKRMGSQRGALDLKLHMWFRSVRSWRVVEEGQLVPPYVPIWSDDDDDTIVEASRSKYSSSLAKRNRRSGLPGVRRVEIVEHKPDDNGERKATASAAVDRASIPPRSSKKTASTSSLNPAASDKPRHTSGVDLSKKSSSSLTHSIIGSTSAFNSSISGSTSMFGRSSADNMLEGDLGDIFRDF
ncbi:kinase-like domain-containing protein [Polychytrium aggregatum]|uniref:kinase-like domain-containing protein n=1 Tax=Polychytrium aggregatum TaxID=110093 RepID=UPI0022FE39C6|nr:kinase-like domain-containing protein [Polychytrium aggregatum]KAI9199636.1 kinase-like domain-containing protein [Polychytrium aggregatum]